jgi:Ca-activated chloride channel family protein
MSSQRNYLSTLLLPFALVSCMGTKMNEPEMDQELTLEESDEDGLRRTADAGERARNEEGGELLKSIEAERVASQDPAPPPEAEPSVPSADEPMDVTTQLETFGYVAGVGQAEVYDDEGDYLGDDESSEALSDGDLDSFRWDNAPRGAEAVLESRSRGVSTGRDRRAAGRSKDAGGQPSPKAQAEHKPKESQPASGPALTQPTTSSGSTTSVLGGATAGLIAPDDGAYVADLKTAPSKLDANRESPNTEAFTHYGVNDMTLVEGDRFSTFSVDVDTASYSIARRKLREGWMPQTASVRVEEFVNSMDYDYEAPDWGSNDGAPFAVHMESAPSPWQGNHHVLRVGVQGKEIPAGARKPVHLTFLVDTSGSMSSADKLGLAKGALHELVGNLGEEDTVAIATYAGESRVVLEPTSALRQASIHRAIEELSSGGGTHMDSGMNLAYQLASESYLHGAENRVVVLSDGDANIGRTTHEEILRTVQHHAEEGITLTTVGFGMGNYKDTMMEQLANKGDGNYFYVDSMAEAEKVFGEDLSGTITTIAKDVKIQVEFNPEAVIAYRLIGYENRDIADKDFRNDRVDAGEIGSGHAVTALYDVVLKDDAPSMELATVRLRAKKPGPDSAAKEWATVMDGELMHAELASSSQDFRIALAAASFAELLRGSPYMVEVSYADVWNLANGATRSTDEDTELLGLIATAAQLSGERGPLATR